jgi:hypothetical protein
MPCPRLVWKLEWKLEARPGFHDGYWSVRVINERDIDLRVGYETDAIKPKDDLSLVLRQSLHMSCSKENRRCGGNVGLKTSSGIQQ